MPPVRTPKEKLYKEKLLLKRRRRQAARRLIKQIPWLTLIGYCGFWLTTATLLNQNSLLRRQNELTEEQNIYDRAIIKRREILKDAYDLKEPIRLRVEAVKAFTSLERKLSQQLQKDLLVPIKKPSIDLTNIDLSCPHRGAPTCADLKELLLEDIDFTGSKLQGANLRGANLKGSHFLLADLSYADLSGAIFTDAKLRDGALETRNLPVDELAYRLQIGLGMTSVDAKEAAINLRQRMNLTNLDKEDTSALPQELILQLNAAARSAKVEGTLWGNFALQANRTVNLPFGIVSETPYRIYEP